MGNTHYVMNKLYPYILLQFLLLRPFLIHAQIIHIDHGDSTLVSYYIKQHNASNLSGRSDFSIGYGKISGFEILNKLSEGGGGEELYEQRSNTGNVFATYRYRLSKMFSIGFTAGYQQIVYDYYSGPGNYPYSLRTETMFTSAIEIKRMYICNMFLQVYWLMGAGILWYTERDDPDGLSVTRVSSVFHSTLFNCQYSPLGINIGGQLRFFGEFGLGYKGLIHGGLDYFIPAKNRSIQR